MLKNIIFALIATLLLSNCQAQSTAKCQDCISTKEITNHIGEVVKVMGTVKKVSFIEWEKGSPTFIDLDQAYPNNALNVVYFEQDRDEFIHLQHLEGKKIIVRGKVEMHHFDGNANHPPSARPQIQLTDKTQIEVL